MVPVTDELAGSKLELASGAEGSDGTSRLAIAIAGIVSASAIVTFGSVLGIEVGSRIDDETP